MSLSTAGVLNVTGNLQENGTNISSKYLLLSGGTLTNTLTGTTINATTLQISGVGVISSNILNDVLGFYSFSSLTPSYIYLNNYTSNYISSNIIVNLLTPYDTISSRNTALSSYLPRSGGNITGNLGIGTATPDCKLEVYSGMVNITNTSPYAVANNYMTNGSLTIGDILSNYGNGSSWNTNTA